ncbi:Gfo/Idh/MocA family protein [Metabacillus halosaccharovorans]|uniref:Gfo/Idh/MocA family protein n=1 Tax=Metabacillus halosaccharovorans TaxID=930124 RepID=UPI001C1FF522|nr:Gfo/Idh/MocA family oxidoreductase [Metabacillus halosaccharovorans]
MINILGIEGEITKTDKEINLAVIGCGSHSFRNIFSTLQFLPVNLVATCDINEEKAKLYAKKFGASNYYTNYEEMLINEQIDGVITVLGFDETGNPRYPKIVPKILKMGIPVWLEKPPAATAKEINVMTDAMIEGGTFYQVGFKKMFMPAIQKVKEIISSPNFGEVSTYTMTYPVDLPQYSSDLLIPESRRFIDDFVHVASTIVFLFGKPKQMVYYRQSNSGGFVNFFHRNNTIGSVHFCNGKSTIAPLEQTEIVGLGENLVLDNNIKIKYYKKATIGSYGRTPSFIPEEGCIEEFTPEFSLGQLYNKGIFLQGYYQELLEFVSCLIENRRPKKAGYTDATSVMEIIDSFSYPQGQIVEIGSKPVKHRITRNENHQYNCPNCSGYLILKDGWNYSCKECGRSIDYRLLS